MWLTPGDVYRHDSHLIGQRRRRCLSVDPLPKSVPPAGFQGVQDALSGHCQRGFSRRHPLGLTALQHLARVLTDLLSDHLERVPLRAAVILDGGADHTARIRDEVGDAQDASLVEDALGLGRDGDVGTLG